MFRELKGAGLQPTPQCYTSLLAACARAGDLTAARRVFKSMHVPPSVEAYTALMDACLKKSTPAALDEAFQVMLRMRSVHICRGSLALLLTLPILSRLPLLPMGITSLVESVASYHGVCAFARLLQGTVLAQGVGVPSVSCGCQTAPSAWGSRV